MIGYLPYRSEAARDSYFAYYDAMAKKKWPVASEDRTVRTSQGETFVRITGPKDAPPLVMLPGASAPSLMWAPNVEALSAEYRTVAVDQIGDAGRSLWTKPVQTREDLVVWLNELFDGLELGSRINLMGVSFGGWLSANYAKRYPERIAKAVLLAPGGAIMRIRAEFWIRIIIAMLRGQAGMRSAYTWMFPDMIRKDAGWIEEELERIAMGGKCLAHRRLPLPGVWTDAELASFRVPALVLVGEHEVIYDAGKLVRRLRRVAPQIAVEVIPGAGHDLTMVQADLVDRRVLEFLRQPVSVR